MAERIDIDALARRIADLPPLPGALAEVMRTLGNDGLPASESIGLIERDQALAARTLRLANSAFYGAPGRVRSIADAVLLLGLRTVATVLAAVALRESMARLKCPGFHFEAYWRHALGTGLAARELAHLCNLDPDESFLAGLLHDVGQLVLAAFAPAEAAAAMALARANDLGAHEAEQRALGITHSEVGAMVARHWRFPASITATIADHHAPPPPPPGERAHLSGIVHVADVIVHALDVNDDPDDSVAPLDHATWQALRLSHGEAMALFARTDAGLAELAIV